MNGFVAWVQGPGGVLVLTPCALAIGWINGWLTRSLVQDRRERRWRRAAMARRTRPVYRQPPSIFQQAMADGAAEVDRILSPPEDRFAAIREAGRQAWAIQQERAAAQQAHEAWLAHTEQALDLASGDPGAGRDVLAEIHADLDRFIAEVVHGGQQ